MEPKELVELLELVESPGGLDQLLGHWNEQSPWEVPRSVRLALAATDSAPAWSLLVRDFLGSLYVFEDAAVEGLAVRGRTLVTFDTNAWGIGASCRGVEDVVAHVWSAACVHAPELVRALARHTLAIALVREEHDEALVYMTVASDGYHRAPPPLDYTQWLHEDSEYRLSGLLGMAPAQRETLRLKTSYDRDLVTPGRSAKGTCDYDLPPSLRTMLAVHGGWRTLGYGMDPPQEWAAWDWYSIDRGDDERFRERHGFDASDGVLIASGDSRQTTTLRIDGVGPDREPPALQDFDRHHPHRDVWQWLTHRLCHEFFGFDAGTIDEGKVG
ncbi:MAG: hypothetical protein KDK70_25495 [Myxococcales bacterium]|nr:hypothetical protein [Myxococcales bacterium]